MAKNKVLIVMLVGVFLAIGLFLLTQNPHPDPLATHDTPTEQPIQLDDVLEIEITDPNSENYGRTFVCEFHDNGNMVCVEQ